MSGDVTGQGMTKPSPPPEAVLIRLAREAARIKAPVAAKAAGISPARWSQVETGYETRLGIVKPVRAPGGTLAHMANAVGVTAERLEEAGRPDAAAVLREIQRQPAPDSRPDIVREHWDDENIQALWALNVSVDQRLSLIEVYVAQKLGSNGDAAAGGHLAEANLQEGALTRPPSRP